jgi:hypothetical protein
MGLTQRRRDAKRKQRERRGAEAALLFLYQIRKNNTWEYRGTESDRGAETSIVVHLPLSNSVPLYANSFSGSGMRRGDAETQREKR